MNSRHRKQAIIVLSDLIALIVSFYVSCRISGDTTISTMSIRQVMNSRIQLSTVFLSFVLLLLFIFICATFGLYRLRRVDRYKEEAIDITKAASAYTLLLAIACHFYIFQPITVRMIAALWITLPLSILLERSALRLVAAGIRSSRRDVRYIVILGTNHRALEFANRISNDPDVSYRVLGFVDDDWPGMPSQSDMKFRLVSDIDGLGEFLRRNIVDEVAIYLPFGSYYQHSASVADLCAHHGITMRFDSDIFGSKSSRWRAEAIDKVSYVTTYAKVRDAFWPRLVKRMVDVVIGTLALLACSPILILAVIAIKLSSRGPILFLQERIGLNKRRFKILKFRTMVPDAEKLMPALEEFNEASGPVFKIKNDPRIVPIGRFLRKTSIDELPQLINVIKGDMSLVGPRPMQVRDFNQFDEDWQRRRFSVKPGMTCLWQVNGRSDISFHQWMLLDLKYLDEWSLWLDFKILAKTVPVVLRGSGAV